MTDEQIDFLEQLRADGWIVEKCVGAPKIQHLIAHLVDQCNKRQWLNAFHVLGELTQKIVSELKADLNK